MHFRYLPDLKSVTDFIRAVPATSLIVMDLETTGLNPRKDKIKDIVLSAATDEAVMFSGEWVDALLLIPATTPLVLHNFRFDYAFLHYNGVVMPNPVSDTMLLHHLHNENESHSLDAIVQQIWKDPYKADFWAKHKTYEDAGEDEKLAYACKDVIYTRRLYAYLMAELQGDGTPGTLVEHVHRLALALYRTEINGVLIDLNYLHRIGDELASKISVLKAEMQRHLKVPCEAVEMDLWVEQLNKRSTAKGKKNVPKPEFNFDSTKHLQNLLYGKLKLPVQKGQKTKKPTTDDAALTTLAKLHPAVQALQDYRGHQKVYTSFIVGTLEKMENGRVFPSFNVNGTVTGRISSSNPNMQQLPRDGGIRGMYIPDPGHKLITCDYSQLEIVIAAHLSNDPVMLQLINDGKSMHDHTAAVCGIERQAAKTVNFLTIYGGTEYRLAIALGIAVGKAKRILDSLWETYKGLKGAIDEAHAQVEAGEPIVNIYGRKRRFPTDLTGRELERAKRQAFNAKVQGSGADLTHEAYYTVEEVMRNQNWGRALYEVHDEIVIMPKDEYCTVAASVLKSVMVEVGRHRNLRVPLSVDCSEPLERWEK